jgi:hypothetical protein
LLGCALVRAWPGGVRSDLGRRVLLVIEEVARRPGQSAELRFQDLLLARFSEFQAGPWWSFGGDAARVLLDKDRFWVQVFAREADRLCKPTNGLPHGLLDVVLAVAQTDACNETVEELKQIEEALTPPAPAPRGLVERLFGVPKPKGPSREKLCAAILGRLPEAPAPIDLSGCWAENQLHEYRRDQRVAETTAKLCAAVREVVGDPFRPWSVRPDWLTAHDGAVRRIAENIDSTGHFADVPVLGDALEDAGCSDAAALAHCRDGGPHAFGCWVLDAILERCSGADTAYSVAPSAGEGGQNRPGRSPKMR